MDYKLIRTINEFDSLFETIRCDRFLAMPVSAQLLYIHVWLAKDEDGFVYNVNTIAKAIRSTGEDIDTLHECGFLASDKEWKYYVNDKILADLGAEEI